MNVIKWLEQVKKLDELINAKLAERDQVWSMLTNVTLSEQDDMPHAKGNISDPVGNGVVKLQMLSEETDKLVDEYIDHKKQVIAMLEKLSPNEYGALHRHYIRYMTWEKVAEDMELSRQQIWRIKKKGLKNLEMLLNVTLKSGIILS